MSAQVAGSIAAALRSAAHRLTDRSESPRLDAEVLLRHVLGIDRAGLFLRLDEGLDARRAAAFAALVERRAAGAPIAYLTGTREFMGLPFKVSPAVLIPRPETEVLVEWALAWLQAHPTATVVDIGTGSGAIAVSLAAHAPAAWRGLLVAADVSAGALAAAGRNRYGLLTAERRRQVRLLRGSLLHWCGGPVDLVLANLPYLTPAQLAATPALAAEPRIALDGGTDGLQPVRALVADLPRVLSPGGAAGLELDPAQAPGVARLLAAMFPAATVGVLPDLAGLDRHVVVTRSRNRPGFA